MSSRTQGAAARPLTQTAPARRPALTAIPGGAPDTAGRSRLRLVRAPLQARSRTPFIVLCMSILGAALLCALLLNTTMARGSFEVADLRQQVGQVAQDTQQLRNDVRAAEASLPERARGLGMVESEPPRMLRLSDGAAIGATEAEGTP